VSIKRENTDMKKFIAEFLGTAFLLLSIVGSGAMVMGATQDPVLRLFVIASVTVVTLFVAINLMAPLSGAHFNPAVSLVALLRKELSLADFMLYLVAQLAGGVVGVVLANLLYKLPAVEISTTERSGSHLFLAEIVATFGLILAVFASWMKISTMARSSLIVLWIGGAYFFTSSASFANPAVTFARIFTDSYTGIAPASVLAFIAAQLIGALVAFALIKTLAAKSE
jgi:glycerol uptake facilitator-like aquaporin